MKSAVAPYLSAFFFVCVSTASLAQRPMTIADVATLADVSTPEISPDGESRTTSASRQPCPARASRTRSVSTATTSTPERYLAWYAKYLGN